MDLNLICKLNYANWATSSQPHRITFEKDVVLHSKPREYSNLKRRQLKFTYIHNNQRHQDVSNYGAMSEWGGLLRRVGAQENRGGRGGTGGKRKRSKGREY